MKPIVPFLSRNLLRVGRGVARRLDRLARSGECFAYRDDFPSRDIVIRDIYKKIDAGMPWNEAVRDARACKHGERVAEYPYIYAKLRELKPRKLLDVGCVMNNPVIDPYIPPSCQVSFLNPAFEYILRTKATYHRSPLEEFTPSETYDLVTCLSTIEHIGFDNTRYGTALLDQGWDWDRTIREFLGILRMFRRLAAPQSEITVSMPYGRKEFVHFPPVTGPRVWQVAHLDHVNAINNDTTLGKVRLVIMKLEREGWRLSRPDESYETFGAVGTAASGLLIIEMKGSGSSPG